MSDEPNRRASFFRRGSIFGDKVPSRRLSVLEEFGVYQEAVKRASVDGETVVGVDEDGVVTTVPLLSLKPTKRGEWKLLEVVESMLNASAMIYTLATMRSLAKIHAEAKPGWGFGFFGKVEKIELKLQHLLLADTIDADKDDVTRNLKKDIVAMDVISFITANLEVFDKLPDDEINTDRESIWNIFTAEDFIKSKDAFLAEFDDNFANTECVYAVTVNRGEKRITITFRGSVTGGKDWATNFNAFLAPIDTPKNVGLDKDKVIKVHSGFKSYLFDSSKEGSKDRGAQKFDDVVIDLKRLYDQKEFADYELFITGHSLGGALCTLLGFKLAGSKNRADFIPKPIKVVSFASPRVGDDVFNEAFELLEKKKLIRCIRVSNEGDVVPVAPPNVWGVLSGYTQTGINIHVLPEGKMQVGHRNIKTFYEQFNTDAATHHSLKDYRQRIHLDENIEVLNNNTIESLYAAHFQTS